MRRCVFLLKHCRQRIVCQAPIMSTVAAHSHIITSALLLPLLKDALSLLLRRVIQLGREIKRHTNGKKSTRHAGGDSCSESGFGFAREKMFNCGFCHILSIRISSSSPFPFISKWLMLSLFSVAPLCQAPLTSPSCSFFPHIFSALHHMKKIATWGKITVREC